MLELKNVSYTVDTDSAEREILRDISLKVDERFVAITGPNGGGKSTLAKMIAGIIRPTAGQIFLDGEDITDRSITERSRMGISGAQADRIRGVCIPVRGGAVRAGVCPPGAECEPVRRRTETHRDRDDLGARHEIVDL